MVPAANPHNARIPDFDLERYRAARQPLVDDFAVTHEQAAQRLAAMWQAQNVIDREEWDNQQDELAEAARLQQEERQQEEEELQRTLDEEKELAKQEERKKNRNKFLPYNRVPVSSTIMRLPLPLAIRKLKKGDYVELYYFTNKGLADAEASTRSADDDALALTRDEDGHHAFIPATAAKTKDTVLPDKDLTWTEFDEAAPRILQSMRENGWEEERIQSHLNMWMKLSAHPFRHDPDEYGKRALIVYQDTVRRRWHNLLGTTQSFDLVPINMDMIKEIRDDLLHKSNKALREEAFQASTIPRHSFIVSISSFHPIPTFPFSRYTFSFGFTPTNCLGPAISGCTFIGPGFRFTAYYSGLHATTLHYHTGSTPHDTNFTSRSHAPQTNQQLCSALALLRAPPTRDSARPTYPQSSSTSSSATPHKRQPSGAFKRPGPSSPDPIDRSHKRSKSFRAADSPNGANQSLPTCSVCLGCEAHSMPVVYCPAEKTWDNKHDTYAKRVERKLYGKLNGLQICTTWQRPESCSDKHTPAHVCSGCGSALHGAHACPRAQKKVSSNSL